MKRVSKKSLEKLSLVELETLLKETQQEKKYLMSIDKNNRLSGQINTKCNQISSIKDAITALKA
jgi:hypothetical protein